MKYAVILAVLCSFACSNNNNHYVPPPRPVVHQPTPVVVQDVEEVYNGSQSFPGVVLSLLRVVNSAQGLQRALNSIPQPHNLDLDQNGMLDLIRVWERQSSGVFSHKRIFSIQAYVYGEWTTVLRIDVTNNSGRMRMEITGNEDVYGPGYYLTPDYDTALASMAFFAWAYRPSRTYRPYWDLRYSPSTYRHRTVKRTVYRNRTKTVKRVKTTRNKAPKIKRSGKHKMTRNSKVNNRRLQNSSTQKPKALAKPKQSVINKNRKHGYKETKSKRPVGNAFGTPNKSKSNTRPKAKPPTRRSAPKPKAKPPARRPSNNYNRPAKSRTSRPTKSRTSRSSTSSRSRSSSRSSSRRK